MRVALIPDAIPSLTKNGLTVLVESGAGQGAFFQDTDYEKAGERRKFKRGRKNGGSEKPRQIEHGLREVQQRVLFDDGTPRQNVFRQKAWAAAKSQDVTDTRHMLC
jgi:hypothetical protein